MENLKTKVENIKSILDELITLLENNSTDATALKKTYVLLEITKDEKKLEKLVEGLSKLIQGTMKDLEEASNKVSRIKNETNEKIDNYNDSKESEELINNL